MSAKRYVPALIVGGSVWALIYSTVGLIGITALAKAYAVAPGLTVGLGACFVLAIVGLIIGLRRGEEPAEADTPDGGPATSAPAQ